MDLQSIRQEHGLSEKSVREVRDFMLDELHLAVEEKKQLDATQLAEIAMDEFEEWPPYDEIDEEFFFEMSHVVLEANEHLWADKTEDSEDGGEGGDDGEYDEDVEPGESDLPAVYPEA